MTRRFLILCVVVPGALAIVAGCRPQQPFYFREDGDLSHYLDRVTQIEYPDLETVSLDEVNGAIPPLTLDNPDPAEYWELPLEEAVQIALANSKVIRQLPTPGFAPRLLSSPDAAPTVYDPALTETSNGFARPIGVAAALGEFDAVLDSFVRWDKNDQPVNVGGFGGLIFAPVREEDLGSFQAQIRKTAATGGTFYLRHNVNYTWSNSPIRAEPSDWAASLEAEFSQPLLEGFGTRFTRIYGPRQTSLFGNGPSTAGRSPEAYRGVMIARLNTDISLADFEAQVQNLVLDVERGYWDLYLAYRSFDALREGRDKALDTWQKVRAEFLVGKSSAQDEAQARHQYFEFKGAVENSLSGLYTAERNLRYVMGLAATDSRLIRPADKPTEAEVKFDFYETHNEAMVRSVELRRQKWQIKGAELRLIAAKNLVLPELNAGGIIRWRGLGDDMLDPDNTRNNAYGSMTGGNFQEWSLRIDFSMPFGFRKELAGVRNAELRLTRERAVLREGELAVSHQLSQALGDVVQNYYSAGTRFNQRLAAQKELDTYEAREREGLPVREGALDRKLDAQRRVATAEIEYFRSLVEYNKAIAQVHLRKGSLLEYNGVYLAEGPWPAKAYFDAHRRARARDASLYLDYGFTRPKVISRGEYEQHAGVGPGFPAEPVPENGLPPEVIPTPEPEPVERPSPDNTEAEPEATSGLNNAGGEAVAIRSGHARPAPAPGKNQSNRSGNRYDLGSLNLEMFAAKPAGDKRALPGRRSAIRPAGYQQVDSSTGGRASKLPENQWRSVKRSGTGYESVANPSAAEADRNASGWTGRPR